MEAVTEPLDQGAFSMELSQDQLDVREWVHGFAANVVRPAAAEWDEREETPWPLIQEAAKIGLYSLRGARAVLRRRVRPDAPDRQRGAVLGRRRDRHVDHGHDARGRRDLLLRHRRAVRRVGAAVLRHGGRARRSPRSASPSPMPAATCRALRTRARYDAANDEWVSTARRRGPPTAASPTCT